MCSCAVILDLKDVATLRAPELAPGSHLSQSQAWLCPDPGVISEHRVDFPSPCCPLRRAAGVEMSASVNPGCVVQDVVREARVCFVQVDGGRGGTGGGGLQEEDAPLFEGHC